MPRDLTTPLLDRLRESGKGPVLVLASYPRISVPLRNQLQDFLGRDTADVRLFGLDPWLQHRWGWEEKTLADLNVSLASGDAAYLVAAKHPRVSIDQSQNRSLHLLVAWPRSWPLEWPKALVANAKRIYLRRLQGVAAARSRKNAREQLLNFLEKIDPSLIVLPTDICVEAEIVLESSYKSRTMLLQSVAVNPRNMRREKQLRHVRTRLLSMPLGLGSFSATKRVAWGATATKHRIPIGWWSTSEPGFSRISRNHYVIGDHLSRTEIAHATLKVGSDFTVAPGEDSSCCLSRSRKRIALWLLPVLGKSDDQDFLKYIHLIRTFEQYVECKSLIRFHPGSSAVLLRTARAQLSIIDSDIQECICFAPRLGHFFRAEHLITGPSAIAVVMQHLGIDHLHVHQSAPDSMAKIALDLQIVGLNRFEPVAWLNERAERL